MAPVKDRGKIERASWTFGRDGAVRGVRASYLRLEKKVTRRGVKRGGKNFWVSFMIQGRRSEKKHDIPRCLKRREN